MRWGRGFFRLWLLIAILWVGIAAFINFAGHPYFPALYVGMIEHGERVNAVTPWSKDAKGLETLEQSGFMKRTSLDKIYPDATYFEMIAIDVPEQASRLQKVTSYLEAERTKVESEYRTSCLQAFLYLGVLPPLLLLGLGAAIGWALAGFRRASQ